MKSLWSHEHVYTCIDIGSAKNAGCSYSRPSSCTYESNNGMFTYHSTPLEDGDTVRMILDFTCEPQPTIEFIVAGVPLPMIKAGVGGGQPLRVAMSCCGRGGARVRLTACTSNIASLAATSNRQAAAMMG